MGEKKNLTIQMTYNTQTIPRDKMRRIPSESILHMEWFWSNVAQQMERLRYHGFIWQRAPGQCFKKRASEPSLCHVQTDPIRFLPASLTSLSFPISVKGNRRHPWQLWSFSAARNPSLPLQSSAFNVKVPSGRLWKKPNLSNNLANPFSSQPPPR